MTEARKPSHRAAVILSWAVLSSFAATPVLANGEIVITQAKAVAGNVTPGDSPGFPITLSQPGAYVLESNITVPAGTYGIMVTTNNVDIDMNGFVLSGGGSATYGVVSASGESAIHDGIITLFLNSAIYLRGEAWVVKGMQVVSNGGLGIDGVDARFITVSDSLFLANGNMGIQTGDDGVFRNNIVSNNRNAGVGCLASCLSQGNKVENNYFGISFESGLAIGNTITGNSFTGLFGAGKTGAANNMFLNNFPGGNQINGVFAVHPNTCVGKPC